MAKFEVTKKVRTPDGVDHDTVAAAHAHMRKLAVAIVGAAGEADLRYAVETPDTENPTAIMLRDAIRDVYLMAWPRAPRDSKTAPGDTEPAAPATTPQDGGTSDTVGAETTIEYDFSGATSAPAPHVGEPAKRKRRV